MIKEFLTHGKFTVAGNGTISDEGVLLRVLQGTVLVLFMIVISDKSKEVKESILKVAL